MGETVFSDLCYSPKESDERSECHVTSGWTNGQDNCPLWKKLTQFCQTGSEIWFLHHYLGLVRDRQFPMLLPQVSIGADESRRPDFVAYVPLQYWKYRWFAIELDTAHTENNAQADRQRDSYLVEHNYEVRSIRDVSHSTVQSLIEEFEDLMSRAKEQPEEVAIESEVWMVTEPRIYGNGF